jgi:hypothetical protein
MILAEPLARALNEALLPAALWLLANPLCQTLPTWDWRLETWGWEEGLSLLD